MGMKGKGKKQLRIWRNTTLVMRKSSILVLVIPEKVKFENIEVVTLASDFDAETELSNFSLYQLIHFKPDHGYKSSDNCPTNLLHI